MSNIFERAMYFVESSEGGVNHDSVDRGGYTKFGISKKQYPNVDFDTLTIEQAREIYYQDYWIKGKCYICTPALAVVMFDSGVNCGIRTATQWLQAAYNKKTREHLIIDGIIGPKTMLAVTSIDENVLIQGVLAYRLQHYSRLVKRYPEQKKFFRGWVHRVSNLMLYAL